MPAWKRDIYIEQGATFPLGFVLHELVLDSDGEIVLDSDGNPQVGSARDLTGCSARMQIRPKVKSDEVLVEATTGAITSDNPTGERIILQAGNVTGRVDVVLTDLDTDKVDVTKAVYDLEIIYPQDSGELRPFTERVLQGVVYCDLNVTRDD